MTETPPTSNVPPSRLGGEPTLSPAPLERAVACFRAIDSVQRLEVVTNGLTPRGCTPQVLQQIDRLSISLYTEDPDLPEQWRRWIGEVAPHVELIFREQREGWAQWTGDLEVSETEAQRMYQSCWYRKHCVTLERRRIFVCSRIPKAARDDEGLRLDSGTTLAQLAAYLNGADALPSCRRCIPMMDLPRVPAGIQPDNRLVRLNTRAVDWLRRATLFTKTREEDVK
ncbi:MAG: hypothetical protein HC927_11855 [Deltaproteobacteria bacterium]|nr:hypothetical protein [Deltaproteobacteria bacterium]